MRVRAWKWLRGGLVFLTLLEGVLSAWAYLLPHSFYQNVPTVALYPPFNEHFVSDYGGLSLAMAVVLGSSAILMERRVIRTAMAAYLAYAVSHLLFHATHPMGSSAAGTIALTAGIAVPVAIPVVLLILEQRVEGTARMES